MQFWGECLFDLSERSFVFLLKIGHRGAGKIGCNKKKNYRCFSLQLLSEISAAMWKIFLFYLYSIFLFELQFLKISIEEVRSIPRKLVLDFGTNNFIALPLVLL